MPPRTVFDIVKSHIRLPINRDYDALKQVLRDWHHYSVQMPLQAKPTFPAELHITITRPSPSAQRDAASKKGRSASAVSSVFARGSRRWSLWRKGSASPQQLQSMTEAGVTTPSSETAPVVYKKVIPLHVWTAVLPWEMQRGLSFSDLRLPPSAATAAAAASTAAESSTASPSPAAPAPAHKGEEEEEEDDPYGVVTSSAAVPPARTLSVAATAAPTSVTAATPAMLFLSDVIATRAYGIGFWSGGIVQPIDVLFVAPTLPSSVGPQSPSFQQLREQDGRAAVAENHTSRAVLDRFFPLHEVSPPEALRASSSSVTFRVHSFSHLDPLPASLHPSRLDTAEGRAAVAAARCSVTAVPDAPYNSPKEAPRYVLEAPRHTLQPAVAAALRESRRLVMHDGVTAATAAGRSGREAKARPDDDADAEIDMTVCLSSALSSDLFAKAQLCVEYVALLEQAIAHYAKELSTDHTARAVAADPLDGEAAHAGDDDVGGEGAERNRRVKVWLSEHESRWMTPDELRRASQSADPVEEDRRAVEQESMAENTQQDSAESEADQQEEEAARASSLTSQEPSPDLTTTTFPGASLTAAELAAQAVGAAAAQPGAVNAARSIGHQSPMLADEAEGRPSYLAPSFVGRHESATLQQSAVVLSADKLARYPKTHSHMPQLPPIDYELFDLCTRLGVGQQAILYHYHDRILREWRAELQRRRRAQKAVGGAQTPETSASLPPPPLIDAEDVARMVALVRDRSLQVSPELVSLVEAVVAAA